MPWRHRLRLLRRGAWYALALAGAVALPLLQLSGFRPAEANDTNALRALLLLYAALPLLLRGIAVTALIFLHRKGAI